MENPKPSKPNTPAATAKPATPTPAAPVTPVKVPGLFRRVDWLALLIAFGVVWMIYFLTLAPEETLEDSGELCTGAFYAGIPHPPGYPFWSIYAWLWTKLLTVGNVAWRVEMGESFAAAMGCGLVAFMVSRGSSMLMEGIEDLKNMTGKWETAICLVSGIVAGVSLGLGGVMWSESVAINRISLFGVPWAMMVMVCLMRWIYAPHQHRYLYWAWFFLGICTTVHQTLLVASMAIEAAIVYVQPKLGRNLLFGNVIVFLGILALQALGISTMLNTSGMVLFLFYAVGVGSCVAFAVLALKEDISNSFRDAGLLLLVGAAVGTLFLGFKNPLAFAVAAAAIWALVWFALKTKAMGWEWLIAIVLGILFAVGAGFYFYEPIAGMTNPPMEWGYPRTVDGFFHALSRGQYEKANPSDIFHDPIHFLLQVGMLLSDVIHEYNWVCLFLAVVPFMFFLKMKKRERAWMIALFAMYSCIGLLLLVLMNPQPDKQSADLNRVFFTSSHAVIAIMIGYGLALTAAYIATHYKRFRSAGFMLAVVALVPALIAFYNGISNTFYGGSGFVPYNFVLLLFVLIAAALVLTALAAQKWFRLADPAAAATHGDDKMFFMVFAGAAIVLLGASIWAVYFRPAFGELPSSLKLSEVFGAVPRIFAPHQYSLPAIGGLLVLGVVVAFIGALLVYRQRAPLAITLALFALMPISSGLSHWAGSEQRNHWFGYWFGHDMFTPPVVGPDGKMTYDKKVREQMAKGPNANLVYPEMTKDTILFGGTDPGRFNPTYMIFCDSFLPTNCLPEMDPVFDRRDVYLITQNALADPTYLNYLRAQYFRSQQKDPPFFSELARFVLKDKDYQTNLLAKMVSPLDDVFMTRGANIEKRWRTSTSWFDDKSFIDVKGFAAKLRAKQDAVSKWIFDNVTKETQDLITSSSDESKLRGALERDLNVLLERELKQKKQLDAKQAEKNSVDQEIAGGDDSPKLREKQDQLAKEIAGIKVEPFYTSDRFAGVNLSDYLKAFIQQNPQSDTRIRLNRLLLEAVYPTEIAKTIGGVYPDREIYIPSPDDSQRAFAEYMGDAQRRILHDQQFPNEPRQVKPGEDVHMDEGGRVQVSGQIAVMSINGLLTKVIFDHNPDNEFYVEESFPLDWMFPHLTPYGVIMKINRQPLSEITDDICKRDHEFWSKYSERLIGNWITYETSVKDIADFAERVYLKHDFTGFKGDPAFVRDESAQKAFSKLRSSIGGIYSWRLGINPGGGIVPPEYAPRSEAQRKRMEREAEFAYKQAFAFCPYSPEAVYRYINVLLSVRRLDDAIIVAETCQKLDPYNNQIASLINNLKGYKGQSGAANQLENEVTQLEADVRKNPDNFTNQFEIATKLLQLGQNERAYQVLDGVLANPRVTVGAVLSVADGYSRLNRPDKLENALRKLTQLEPNSPEAWCDLAAAQTMNGKDSDAVACLKTALDLNAKRLAANPKTNDLKSTVATDQRFAKLHDLPDFKTLIAQH